MSLFETTVILNQLPLEELRRSTISRRGRTCRRLLIVITASIFMFTLFQTITGGGNVDAPLPWLLVALIASWTSGRFPRNDSLFLMISPLSIKREEKHASSTYRLTTLPPLYEIPLTMSFQESGFDLRDDGLGVVIHTAYDDIRWIVETNTFFALYGKRKIVCGIIDKTIMDDAEKREQLIAFLKRNCTHAKWDHSWALGIDKGPPKRTLKKKIAIFLLAALSLSAFIYSFFIPLYVIEDDRMTIYRLDSLPLLSPVVHIIQFWTDSGYVVYFSDIADIKLLPYSARQLSEMIDDLHVPPRRGGHRASGIATGYFGNYYLNVMRVDNRFPTIWIERYDRVPVLFSFNSSSTEQIYERLTMAWRQQ